MVSYLMQWAAVRTQLLATRVPPQVWDHFPKDWYCRETCGGRGAQAHGWEGTGGRQGGQGTSLRPVFLPKPRAPNPPAFTSWVLGLQVCVSKPSYRRSILMLYRKKNSTKLWLFVSVISALGMCGQEDQGQSWLCTKFQDNLDYLKPCLKTATKMNTNP